LEINNFFELPIVWLTRGSTDSCNYNGAELWAAFVPFDASTGMKGTAEGQVGTIEPGLIGSFIDQSSGEVCLGVVLNTASNHDLGCTCSHHAVLLDWVGHVRKNVLPTVAGPHFSRWRDISTWVIKMSTSFDNNKYIQYSFENWKSNSVYQLIRLWQK